MERASAQVKQDLATRGRWALREAQKLVKLRMELKHRTKPAKPESAARVVTLQNAKSETTGRRQTERGKDNAGGAPSEAGNASRQAKN